MVRIWEDFRKANPEAKKLPGIVPVVLAQNSRRWEIAPGFADLVDVPDGVRPFVPDFAFRLIQLAEMPFEAIRGTSAGILILRTLKAERRGRCWGGKYGILDL